MSFFSHDIWEPGQSVELGPFSVVRERGDVYHASKSAVRTLEILELLAAAEQPLRAVEIGAALGLSPSSTHQLLKTLVDSAYLIFEPRSKRYFPSIRIARLSAGIADAHRISLEELVPAAEQAVSDVIVLSTSQGSFMQVIDARHKHRRRSGASSGPIDLGRISNGARVPIFGSCTGAAWLASQDDETICHTIRLCRRELGRQANKPDKIFAFVERIREQGYAFGGLISDESTRGIAFALPPSTGDIVFVLGIAGRSPDFEDQKDQIVRNLKENIARQFNPSP